MNVSYSVVIPVYNEEDVVSRTYRRLSQVMAELGEDYELIFVNDGSSDNTAAIIQEIIRHDQRVELLEFSRNFGHQAAISAGMDHARGDAVIIIDGDLQDPPELIPEMIGKWREGFEVVYARRAKREGETFFKKWTAALFYRLLRFMTDVDIPVDTGDFRLMDRKVYEAMRAMGEKNRFVRGLVSWVGFRQTAVEYVRDERFAGTSKYPLKKMLRLALDGITAFSYKPLKISAYLGALVSCVGVVYLAFCIEQQVISDGTVADKGPLMACLIILNGLILLSLGIIGEYLARISDEAKNRPLYILRNSKGNKRRRALEVRRVV